MYNKQQIIDTLNNEDIFIDNFILDAFIKNWKIEPIYEDAQGVEFFDDMAIEKIRNGIMQKQPKYEINIMDKNDIKDVDMSVEFSANTEKIETENAELENTEKFEEKSNDKTEFQDTIIEIDENKELPVAIFNEVHKEVENELTKELKQVTLDISNQTLTVLAESIAQKITSDVSDFIKRTDFIEDAVQLGEYKKDNQLLLQKIDELIADNRKLIEKIEELKKENNSYIKVFGNMYVKSK